MCTTTKSHIAQIRSLPPHSSCPRLSGVSVASSGGMGKSCKNPRGPPCNCGSFSVPTAYRSAIKNAKKAESGVRNLLTTPEPSWIQTKQPSLVDLRVLTTPPTPNLQSNNTPLRCQLGFFTTRFLHTVSVTCTVFCWRENTHAVFVCTTFCKHL